MLKTEATKNLTGNSQIDGKIAAYFNATIKDEVITSVTMTVSGSTLYEANKAVVRADYAEFQERAYALEEI